MTFWKGGLAVAAAASVVVAVVVYSIPSQQPPIGQGATTTAFLLEFQRTERVCTNAPPSCSQAVRRMLSRLCATLEDGYACGEADDTALIADALLQADTGGTLREEFPELWHAMRSI